MNKRKIINVNNLSKKYKDILAVDNISFSVEEGSLFALLGVNGAGKSTTIHILTGLIKKDFGKVTIDEYDIDKDSSKIKAISNVSFQDSSIALNLTVYENLDLICSIYEITNKENRISEIVKLFEFEDYLKTKAKNLSGGYKRRLSIALALITSPKILYLDEPTLGLDVLSRTDLWKIIKSLKGKITIILTTHYLEEVEHLADSIAIMNKGKILTNGSLNDILVHTNSNSLEEAFIKIVRTNKEGVNNE